MKASGSFLEKRTKKLCQFGAARELQAPRHF
jgi:hypothetical protein